MTIAQLPNSTLRREIHTIIMQVMKQPDPYKSEILTKLLEEADRRNLH